MNEEIQKQRVKYMEIDRQFLDVSAQLEKKTALKEQENTFHQKRIHELEKQLSESNETHESKMRNYK